MMNFETLKQYLNLAKELSFDGVRDFIKSGKSQTFAPGEYLIEEGSTNKDLFFMQKGIVRSHITNEKGIEITMNLWWEEDIVTNADIHLHNTPSRYCYVAIETTKTISIDSDILEEIISQNNPLKGHQKEFFLYQLKEQSERIESFILMTPEERYIDFIESYPEIINRVKDKYIANILGITPESLSRIRKRITSRNR
ncbi:MAG: Crp/Fnr family transcriptional regulator [Flavobacteriales bacterium]|nr:Crp/Fnr family transcriptional regulator [Flavobacteriales bacterium]